VIGWRVVRLDEVESTNDMAADLADRGEPEGTAVVAETQCRGRGRHGRHWHSPRGMNIYCSFVLRPARPMREWADLSWVLAAGVVETCRDAGAEDASLKHPNDVMVGDKKLAGLLLETRTGPGAPSAVVAGIGLNVNARAGDLPRELHGSASSLAMLTGRDHDLETLLHVLFGHLDRWYAVWAAEGADGARRLLAERGVRTTGAAHPPADDVQAVLSPGHEMSA
jgi:BirA family biotin operon repressor/biotin-[acetyl-CoA-carboxylase] ligase